MCTGNHYSSRSVSSAMSQAREHCVCTQCAAMDNNALRSRVDSVDRSFAWTRVNAVPTLAADWRSESSVVVAGRPAGPHAAGLVTGSPLISSSSSGMSIICSASSTDLGTLLLAATMTGISSDTPGGTTALSAEVLVTGLAISRTEPSQSSTMYLERPSALNRGPSGLSAIARGQSDCSTGNTQSRSPQDHHEVQRRASRSVQLERARDVPVWQ